MRSKIFTSLTMAFMVVVMLGASALPQASADDDYSPLPPGPQSEGISVDCTDVPVPGLALDGTTVVVTYDEIYLLCVTNLDVQVNPVLYNGPVSATRIHQLPLPPLEPTEHTITVTATTVLGTLKVATLELSAADVAAINALLGASIGDITPPVVPLAVTGSNIDGPIAAGIALVGAGGLALLVARKRERDLAI